MVLFKAETLVSAEDLGGVLVVVVGHFTLLIRETLCGPANDTKSIENMG